MHRHALTLQFWGRRRLPLLLQTEAAECGLASLAMVAGYWGHHIDLANMRRRFSVSLKGSTLKSLIAMAQGLSLQSRPLKLDLQHLPQLALPCVLHWDMNHFVVLTRADARGIKVTPFEPAWYPNGPGTLMDRSAGLQRNVVMGLYVRDQGGGGLIACHAENSSGTAHMIAFARKMKLQVYLHEVKP